MGIGPVAFCCCLDPRQILESNAFLPGGADQPKAKTDQSSAGAKFDQAERAMGGAHRHNDQQYPQTGNQKARGVIQCDILMFRPVIARALILCNIM